MVVFHKTNLALWKQEVQQVYDGIQRTFQRPDLSTEENDGPVCQTVIDAQSSLECAIDELDRAIEMLGE